MTRTPGQIPWNKNTSFTCTPQMSASMVALDQVNFAELDDDVILEKSIDDDAPDLDFTFDDTLEIIPTKGAAGPHGVTMGRLGAEVDTTEDSSSRVHQQEAAADIEFPPLVTVGGGETTATAELSSEADGWMKVTVTPHRRKGHCLVGIAGIIVSMLALLQLLLNIHSSTSCHIFEEAFQYAVLGDFCIVQPLTVAMTYLYRWLTSEEEDDNADTDFLMWAELHPYDGEERPL